YVKARCQKIKEFYDDKSNAIVFNSGMVTKLIGAEKIYSETVKQISSYSMDTSSAHNTGAMIGQNIRVASFRSSYKNVLISDA
ncbi:hypothetical protein, partial [Vibrio parahaemolyticus]